MTLATDPLAHVLGVLREAGHACTAAEIKQALAQAGEKRGAIDAEWPRVQKRLRHHPYVLVEGDRPLTYRLGPQTPPDPVDALEALLAGGLPADVRASYAGLVRDVLRGSTVGSAVPPASAPQASPEVLAASAPQASPEVAGRRRQARIDSLRALAELATEVEELVANEASPRTLVQRVRSRVKRSALEPIDRAGEETTYDRSRHKPIGGSIADGATVIVVRPGYLWKSDDGDVLISRPVVEE